MKVTIEGNSTNNMTLEIPEFLKRNKGGVGIKERPRSKSWILSRGNGKGVRLIVKDEQNIVLKGRGEVSLNVQVC